MKEFTDVIFIDPKNTYISKESVIGEGTVIYPNVHLEGECCIGKNCKILPGTFLVNVKISDNCTIISSRITDSVVGEKTEIGPNAHLRAHCIIGNSCRIGNFVEMKNTQFGDFSKCAHLSYLGDAVVGQNVNIGCGVVTANYDGKNKHQTIIGSNSFIGSGAKLIAPIKIEEDCLIAAGSIITKDVEKGDMAIARSYQVNKKGYGYNFIKGEKND